MIAPPHGPRYSCDLARLPIDRVLTFVRFEYRHYYCCCSLLLLLLLLLLLWGLTMKKRTDW